MRIIHDAKTGETRMEECEEEQEDEYLPPELTEMEKLQEKVATQDAVIEELLFVILPEILGGAL